jgi:Period protein 2/3C-terminal region
MNWNSSPNRRARTTQPQWVGNVELTPDVIYRYEMPIRATADVLNDDLIALKKFVQV